MKQMISIHHMLNFEPGKDDPSPELICYLAESLRNMEKEVPEERAFDLKYQDFSMLEDDDFDIDFEEVTYDETNLSMEQLQELFLATQGISTPQSPTKKLGKNQPQFIRPHYVTPKKRLLWTEKRVDDLKLASALAMQKFKCKKSKTILSLLVKEWLKLNPDQVGKVSKSQILARYKYQIRYEKRMHSKSVQRVIDTWQTMCDNYRINEENIEVIDETVVKNEEPAGSDFGDSPNAKMRYNADVKSRDYNRDDDVLSYLRYVNHVKVHLKNSAFTKLYIFFSF